MKGWHIILLCLGVSLLAVGGTLLLTQQAEEEAPQPDIPRYTADQVIAVAKAYTGEECGGKWVLEPYEATWTTVYLGNGEWAVTKNCSSYGVGTWTFYEATGHLSR